jgi:hypothetical protein
MVHESAFELPRIREGSRRISQGQNRIREIRPSGIVGGLAASGSERNEVMVELGTRCTNERVRVGNSLPKAKRAVFLSRPGSPNINFVRFSYLCRSILFCMIIVLILVLSHQSNRGNTPIKYKNVPTTIIARVAIK